MPISKYLRGLREKIGHELVFMPGVAAIVFNNRGELLLQHNKDFNGWTLIGGSVDPGEEVATCLVREVEEEAGLRVQIERLVGIYTEPPTVYPNQDIVQYMAFVFVCHSLGGQPFVNDDESYAVHFFPLDQLPNPIYSLHQQYLAQALKNDLHADYWFNEHGKVNR